MRPLTYSILQLLRDGKFHFIEDLACSLHVKPSCISKALYNVEHFGILLHEECHGHSYRWINPIKWIDKKEILDFSPEVSNWFQLTVLNTVDSTNSFLLDLVAANKVPAYKNPVIIAEMQTQGRGRYQRPWYSGFGDSLTFSLLWRFDRSINDLSGLSLTIGVAMVRTLTKMGIDGLTLKWPNDILFCFSKLAGILIEHSKVLSMGSAVVIGIGLNIQLSMFTKNNIDQAVVDLYAITGEILDRNKLLAVLLSEVANVLKDFNDFGFCFFREEWISYHAYEGKLISLCLAEGSIIHGVVDGVDYDGSIRLKMPMGVVRSFNSGELMLR